MSLLDILAEKAKAKPQRIIFPEGENSNIIAAASILGAEKLATPLYYGAALLQTRQVDAMVAGIDTTTEEVVLASQVMLGTQPGIQTPSSLFVMEIAGYHGSEGDLIVLADCGICPDPDAEALADIAIATAETTRALLGWEPRIAMLSFSTRGSADHPSLEKVIMATEKVRQRRPDLLIDGELQLDAAIVPRVAQKKAPDSPIEGRANILVSPDLNAGNIAYKAIQQFANANAYGPFLQGFNGVVSDLSRGSGIADIVGVSSMAAVYAQAR